MSAANDSDEDSVSTTQSIYDVVHGSRVCRIFNHIEKVYNEDKNERQWVVTFYFYPNGDKSADDFRLETLLADCTKAAYDFLTWHDGMTFTTTCTPRVYGGHTRPDLNGRPYIEIDINLEMPPVKDDEEEEEEEEAEEQEAPEQLGA